MTYAEFVALVAKMRVAQRQYFRSRSMADLDHSKLLEKRVDEAVRDNMEQPKLFN